LCLLLLMYFIPKNLWFTIHVDSWFWRIIDQICWACAIFCSNLICRHVQTDGRTVSQGDRKQNENAICVHFADHYDGRGGAPVLYRAHRPMG
jgi:hypothetical protein